MARTSIQTRTRKGAQKGFTLIEMAIAVAIFGLLSSGAIMATSAWLGKQALDKTAKNLDRIESALTVYVVQTGRLPCPYDPTAAAPGTYVGLNAGQGCSDATQPFVGLVPYRDLGLQRTDVIDGWNRYITYAVDTLWTNDPAAAVGGGFYNGGSLHTLQTFTPNSASIDVRDADSAATAVCTPPSPTCAAYVLISHGEAGRGAVPNYGVAAPAAAAGAEAENTNAGAVFAAEAYTGATTPFDHILRFRTPAQILRDAY